MNKEYFKKTLDVILRLFKRVLIYSRRFPLKLYVNNNEDG